jgi:hypothetical protein
MAVPVLAAQTPTFAAPKQIPSYLPFGDGSLFGLAGHFNGSANTDLLVYLDVPNFVSTSGIDFLSGDGTGKFTNNGAVTNLPLQANAGFGNLIEMVADVNGDGKDDIIIVKPGCDAASCPNFGNDTAGNVTVMLSEGSGKFAQGYSASFPVGLDSVQSVVGDFNKDGKPDFAVLVYSSDRVEALPPTELYIFLNQGNGLFKPTIYQTASVLSDREGIDATNLVTGDFEGNGNQDLAFAFDTNGTSPVIYPELMTFAGDGTGAFGPGVVKYTLNDYTIGGNLFQNSLFAADLNGDGRTDLVISLQRRPQTLAYTVVANLLANSSGGFKWGSAVSFGTTYAVTGIGLSDLNGDGHLDLIVTASGANSSGEYNFARIYPGTSSGAFNGAFIGFTISGHNFGPYLAEVPLKTGALPSLFVSNSKPVLLMFVNTTP